MRRLLILSSRAIFSLRGHEGYPATGPSITASADTHAAVGIWGTIGGEIVAASLPALPVSGSISTLEEEVEGGNSLLPPYGVKSLLLCFDYTPSLHPEASIAFYLPPSLSPCLSPNGSASVPPCRLPRTFIRETAVLIKELIFSLLSLISIVNLKYCEFFKFPSLLSKTEREGEKKDGNRGDI